MKRYFLIALVLCLVLGGCATASVPDATTEPSTETPKEATTEPATEIPTEPPTEPPTQPEPEITQITLSFTGDCTLGANQKHSYENSFHDYYDRKGPDYFLEKVRPLFEEDDLTVINLEGSLTNSKDIQDKKWNHKGPPKYVKILTGSSVEVATMGNNHRLDYGERGCEETKEVLDKAGIGWCYDDNYLIKEVKGIKVGFVSVNRVYDGDAILPWLEEGYRQLRAQGCQLVIACVHWGQNFVSEIKNHQLTIGYDLIDMGYDLVVGNHPHILQGMQVYKGKFICYSLGNFCYGGSKNPEDKDSGIFRQTFTFVDGVLQPGVDAQFIPCRLSGSNDKNNYRPTLATGETFTRILEKLNTYSAQFGFAWNEEGKYVSD